MSLAGQLSSPLALYRKLERESYRAFHAKTPLHKADHFFNFCVTATSMRDYTLEHLQKTSDADRQPYFAMWAKIPSLAAAAEIANSSKHFVLRDRRTGALRPIKTRVVRMKKATFFDIYANDTGELKVVQAKRTEVTVTLSDGTSLELYAFTSEVLKYWRDYLASLGLEVRRQPFAQLSGK
jgi:hypothetical protein